MTSTIVICFYLRSVHFGNNMATERFQILTHPHLTTQEHIYIVSTVRTTRHFVRCLVRSHPLIKNAHFIPSTSSNYDKQTTEGACEHKFIKFHLQSSSREITYTALVNALERSLVTLLIITQSESSENYKTLVIYKSYIIIYHAIFLLFIFIISFTNVVFATVKYI